MYKYLKDDLTKIEFKYFKNLLKIFIKCTLELDKADINNILSNNFNSIDNIIKDYGENLNKESIFLVLYPLYKNYYLFYFSKDYDLEFNELKHLKLIEIFSISKKKKIIYVLIKIILILINEFNVEIENFIDIFKNYFEILLVNNKFKTIQKLTDLFIKKKNNVLISLIWKENFDYIEKKIDENKIDLIIFFDILLYWFKDKNKRMDKIFIIYINQLFNKRYSNEIIPYINKCIEFNINIFSPLYKVQIYNIFIEKINLNKIKKIFKIFNRNEMLNLFCQKFEKFLIKEIEINFFDINFFRKEDYNKMLILIIINFLYQERINAKILFGIIDFFLSELDILISEYNSKKDDYKLLYSEKIMDLLVLLHFSFLDNYTELFYQTNVLNVKNNTYANVYKKIKSSYTNNYKETEIYIPKNLLMMILKHTEDENKDIVKYYNDLNKLSVNSFIQKHYYFINSNKKSKKKRKK